MQPAELNLYLTHKNLLDKILDWNKADYADIVCFDVGANKGQSIREYSKVFPKCQIHAFEPNIDMQLYLRAEKLANPHNEITIKNFGLGNKNEFRNFYVYKDSTVSSFLKAESFMPNLNQKSWEIVSTRRLALKTLDDYVSQTGVIPNVLKIDTQGFDLNVLLGGQKTLKTNKIAIIAVEIYFAKNYVSQGSFKDILNVLAIHGYKLYDFSRLVHTARGNLYFADATFLSVAAWQSLDLL